MNKQKVGVQPLTLVVQELNNVLSKSVILSTVLSNPRPLKVEISKSKVKNLSKHTQSMAKTKLDLRQNTRILGTKKIRGNV